MHALYTHVHFLIFKKDLHSYPTSKILQKRQLEKVSCQNPDLNPQTLDPGLTACVCHLLCLPCGQVHPEAACAQP